MPVSNDTAKKQSLSSSPSRDENKSKRRGSDSPRKDKRYTTIRVGAFRRITFDENTQFKSSRMNRISSLKQRTAANKHGGNASLLHTPRCSDLEYGRYTDRDCPIDASIASDSHESSEKNPARSQSSSSVPANHSNCASTVDSNGSTNHSSIFSKSDDSCHAAGDDDTRDMLVRDGYVPSKKTLGLELVASPSLLRQVLAPPSSESESNLQSGGSPNSKNSGGRETTLPAEGNMDIERDVVEDLGLDLQEEEVNVDDDDDGSDDIFDDDDSEYTAMQTVAGTVVSTKTKTSVFASDTLPLQEEDTEDIEIGVVPMKSTLSMRSAKSSEGMEVNFRTVYDHDDANVEESSSIGLPFDEGNAKIVASSKVAAIMATRAYQPPSCLKPSTFSGQRTNLPSPAIVQNRRVGRAARLAKLRKTFDRRHLDVEEKGPTTANANHKRRSEGDAQPCFSAPLVSFAENLEETHPMDEVRNDDANNFDCKIRTYEKLGHHSPTGVQEFFSVNDDDVDKHPNKGQEENSFDVGISGTTSSLDDRLARNRDAMKSMASARGSVKNAKSKKSINGVENCVADEMVEDADAIPPEEVMTHPIVQSVSELDIPQFCPSLDANSSKEENVNESMQSTDKHNESESKHKDHQDQDDTVENPSIELDTSVLVDMNTSLDSTSSKKKRFLPRLRLKSKSNTSAAVGKQNTSIDTSSSNCGRKRLIKSKFFRSKSSSKKSDVSKHADAKSEKSQGLAVNDNDQNVSLLSLSQQAASTQEESRKDLEQMLTPGNNMPVQMGEDPPLPKENDDHEKKKDEVPTRSITIEETPLDLSIATAPRSPNGMDTSKVTETSFITRDDEVDLTAIKNDSQSSSIGIINPTSLSGAKSSSTPSALSKPFQLPLHSTSSLHPRNTTQATSDPILIESKSRSMPSRARSIDTHDSSPFLNVSSFASSSCGKPQGIVDGIADFGSSSFDPGVEESLPEMSVDNHRIVTTVADELTQTQIPHVLPGFTDGYVGDELGGESESGVEVEWTKSILSQHEFWDKPVVLDTTAVSAEFERTLTGNPENGFKGDDISWPSDVDSFYQHGSVAEQRPDEDVSLKIVEDSPGSASGNAIRAIEETSTKSGWTKSSSLHPRMLFRNRSKNQLDRTSLQDEEETLSDCKRFLASDKKPSTHFSKKGRRACDYRSSRHISRTTEEDDCGSIDEDSEEYSSEEYSSDDHHDVVTTIATSFQKGFTGIVDMMETAFAFGTLEETADYESESSESEGDDDDSYVLRKMARRRNKQRKLLQDARRSSRGHRSSRPSDSAKPQRGERKKISKSSKYSRDADGSSIVSEEDRGHPVHRHKPSRHRHSSSRRGDSHGLVESRHRDSRR